MDGTNPYTMATRAPLREAPPQTLYWAGLRGSIPATNLAAESSRPLRWYALGLWFVGTALLPLWEWWGGPHAGIPVMVVSTYVGYLLAGTWLAGTPVTPRTRWQLLLLSALTGAWTMAATARLTGSEEMNVALYAYDRPNVLVMSVALFLLLTQAQPAAWASRHPGTLAIIRA